MFDEGNLYPTEEQLKKIENWREDFFSLFIYIEPYFKMHGYIRI